MSGLNRTQPGLTGQEERILQLLWASFTVKEAAFELGIARGTISVHIGRIYRKLQVSSMAGAIRRGLDFGYLEYKRPGQAELIRAE